MTDENTNIDLSEENQNEQALDNQEEIVDNSNKEAEEKARRLGWKSKEEFKGNPDDWTDAESFIKIGEENLPVLKENFRKLEDKTRKLEKELESTKKYQEHIGKIQYERALEQLQKQKLQAVQDADIEAYQSLSDQEKKLTDDYNPKVESSEGNANVEISEADAQTFREWQSRNNWFGSRPEMTEAAYYFEKQLTHLPFNERLKKVEQKVLGAFPEFNAPLSKRDGSGTSVPKRKNVPASKGWNDLPQSARDTAHGFIKKGIITKEQYVKDYFGN